MFSSIFCVVQDLASVFETFFSVYNLQKEKIEVNQSRSVCVSFHAFFVDLSVSQGRI